MTYSVGVDFGGTKIRTGLVKGNKLQKVIEIPTGPIKERDIIVDKIISTIDYVISDINKRDISGIGVGVPGVVNRKKGSIVNLTNIPGFGNFKLSKTLKKKFNLKVRLDNDTNLYGLGEAIYGSGKDKKNIVCLTVGTGLGGTIIVDKHVYEGNGNAGEFGHMIIIKDGLKCKCGSRGCLEQYVSSRAIRRYSKKFLGKIMLPLEIENMARRGNRKAKRVYDEAGKYLGIGLTNLNNILNPDIFVLGGGLSYSGSILIEPAKRVLKEYSFVKPAKVVRAELKRNSGVMGAAYLVSFG